MNRNNPPLVALRAFEIVARKNSFKEAAAELSITPGALSRHVKNLEDYFGFSLFERRKPHLELSEKGILLQEGLKRAFEVIRATVAEVNTMEISPQLLVSAETPLANKWLSRAISEFAASNPGIKTEVASCTSLDEINRNDVDVSISFGNATADGFYSETLGGESLVVVVSPELMKEHNIIHPRDISRVPMLTETSISRCCDTLGWHTWLNAAGIKSVNSGSGIHFGVHAEHAIEAAINGGGVLLTRYTLINNDIAQGRLVIPFGPVLETSCRYQLICGQERLKDPGVESFIRWTRSEFYRLQNLRDQLGQSMHI